MTNDEGQMTKEIRSPSAEGRSGVQWLVRHSDFGIPSDFVIRHSGLRIAVHGGSPFLFEMHWDHERASRLRERRVPAGETHIGNPPTGMAALPGSWYVGSRSEPTCHEQWGGQ